MLKSDLYLSFYFNFLNYVCGYRMMVSLQSTKVESKIGFSKFWVETFLREDCKTSSTAFEIGALLLRFGIGNVEIRWVEAAIGDKSGFLLTFNEGFLQLWIANYLYNLFNLWVNLLLVAIVTFDLKVICEYRLSSQCSLRKSVINLITLRFLYYWALT